MTQQEKEWLIKDICVRLPYGLKAQVWSYWNEDYFDKKLLGIDLDTGDVLVALPGDRCEIERVKPYLRPMESMTEEEEIEYDATFDTIYVNGHYDSEMTYKSFDFLNKKMFDYLGLIPMGLALPAKDGMYDKN